MTDPYPQLARLRLQLAEIALSPESLQGRAGVVLDTLGRMLPFDAAWLAARDPEQRRHTTLATAGPAEPLRCNFQRLDADDEVEQLGLNRNRPPVLASERASGRVSKKTRSFTPSSPSARRRSTGTSNM